MEVRNPYFKYNMRKKANTGLALYFGLPGCGKTTLLAKLALEGVKKYPNVYCNVHLKIPGVIYINRDDIGQYDISDGLLLFDEAQLGFDNRSWGSFNNSLIKYFSMYRHFNMRICFFSQSWDKLDIKIRQLTSEVYYVYKRKITGWYKSSFYRIPYDIIIPSRDSSGAHIGEIIQGYCKPDFLTRIFAHKIYRKKYYKYFDSFERYPLPPLPQGYDGFSDQDEYRLTSAVEVGSGVTPPEPADSFDI